MGSARRRRSRSRARSSARRDLVLDRTRELGVFERVEGEADELDLPVEGMTPPDVDAAVDDLDHVVTGSCVAPEPQRRHRSRIHHEQVLEPPDVWHMLVPGKHKPDTRALEALDGVARVVDDVPLAARPRHGEQMMVQDEDPQIGVLVRELLLDPAVPAPPDLTVVEIRLAGIDGDDGDTTLPEDRVAIAEELLEVDVADVPRVVVTRDD